MTIEAVRDEQVAIADQLIQAARIAMDANSKTIRSDERLTEILKEILSRVEDFGFRGLLTQIFWETLETAPIYLPLQVAFYKFYPEATQPYRRDDRGLAHLEPQLLEYLARQVFAVPRPR